MSNETKAAAGGPPPPEKRKLSKQLPTDRIKFDKQVAIIRAFAATSGPTRRAVSNKEVAPLVNVTDATLSLNNPFLIDVGLIERTEAGFIPSPETCEYKRAYDLGEAQPEHRLGGLLRRSWFFENLRPKLDFGAVQEDRAVTDLGVVAGAGKSDLSRVRMLIEYLVLAGVVRRDESGVLTVVRSAPDDPKPPIDSRVDTPKPPPQQPAKGRR